MTLPRKQVAAAVVLIGGVVAAWLFRHGSSDAPEASTAPSDRLVIRQSITEPSSSTADGARHSDSSDSPTAHLLPPQAAPGGNARPDLPATYDEAAASTARAPQIMQWPPPVSGDRPSSLSGPPAFDPAATDTSQTAGPRTHRVVDGDTLGRLAERYLGNAQWQTEIFAANRDKLKDPDLLPIGAELRIPDDGSRLPLKPVPPGAVAPVGDK